MKRRAFVVAVAGVSLGVFGCGRSDGFGGPAGSLPSLSSAGLVAGSGSGHGGTSAGLETNGTAGTNSNSAGQGSSGVTGGSAGEVAGSTTSGQQGAGTSAGFTATGTGGSSGRAASTGRPKETSGTSGGSSGKAATGGGTSGESADGGTGSTGGNGTTGTGGSGTTTGSGCDATILATLEEKCTVDSDCGCPYTCVSDPPFGMDCEPPCLELSDCPDLGYFCNGTNCQFNACGADSGNGSFNSTCNVTGTDDGTCVPSKLNGTTIGKCYQGGTATTCCNGNATRPGPNGSFGTICEAGFICSGGNDGECGAVCEPGKHGSGCPQDEFCAFELDDDITGGCFGQTSICVADGG